MIRKFGRILVFILLGYTLLYAQAQQTTIDFYWLGDEIRTPLAEDIIKNFEEAHPDINVNLVVYPNEAYKTAIQVALASDNPPDVFFNWSGEDTGRFVREGLLADLTSFAEMYGWNDKLSQASLDAFVFDGKLYGLPYEVDSKWFYYNKAIFETEGLSEPSTFAELLQLCSTLRERGYTPISFGNSERWPGVHYMTILNQKVVGEDRIALDYSLQAPPEELFTDPGYAEAFQKLIDMKEAGCFNNAINATSPEIGWAMFYTGQAVMNYEGAWAMSLFDKNDFAGQYGLFKMPPIEGGRGNQNIVVGAPNGLEMSASADQEAAAKFLDFFVNEASQRLLVERLSRIPANPEALNSQQASPEMLEAVSDIREADGMVPWLDVQLESSLADTYLDVIQKVVGGSMTAEEAANAVREQALISKQNLEAE